MITSRRNPRLLALTALHKAAGRRAAGRSLAEGPRLVAEALDAGVVETVLWSERAAEDPVLDPIRDALATSHAPSRPGAPIEALHFAESCFAKLSTLKAPERVAAVVRVPSDAPESLLSSDARLLIAAGVQDPGNAGALARTAEAASASGCLFLDGIDPTHPKFLRAAAGASFRLPCVAATTAAFLEALARADGPRPRLLAVEAGGAIPYDAAPYAPPVALIVGGEGPGLPAALRAAADGVLTIPMSGRVESLNVAVAAGLCLYAARPSWRRA